MRIPGAVPVVVEPRLRIELAAGEGVGIAEGGLRQEHIIRGVHDSIRTRPEDRRLAEAIVAIALRHEEAPSATTPGLADETRDGAEAVGHKVEGGLPEAERTGERVAVGVGVVKDDERLVDAGAVEEASGKLRRDDGERLLVFRNYF